MTDTPITFTLLFHELIYPLFRLICFISVGLLAANIIESFHWTTRVAFLSRPLIRLGNMSQVAGASFSIAFVSGVSANTMLAEAYNNKKIDKRELILANLFNSLPTYFLHLPTVFFITLPLIKEAAFIYVSLTLGAAMLRTVSIVFISRCVLPARTNRTVSNDTDEKQSPKNIWQRIRKRFIRRIRKIIKFTIPIYILIFFLHRAGVFDTIENFFNSYLYLFPWLTPQAISIVTLHIAAELTAGLAAAGSLLQEGAMTVREIVIALLIGNIISSPIRAVRHQFPYYAGIFQPKLATQLLIYNQSFRAASLIVVTIGYILFS